jgi:hypothetical protein
MNTGVLDNMQSISARLANWNKSRPRPIEGHFDIVEESFRDLETIHNDYSTKLSELREHLASRSLPPKELIQWLRNAGLEYRVRRDYLGTIESEIEALKNQPTYAAQGEARFFLDFREYITSVMNYYECTAPYEGASLFRRSEKRLRHILDQLEMKEPDLDKIADLFYTDYIVQDMQEFLIDICDDELPYYWQKVCSNYRAVRSDMLSLTDIDKQNNRTISILFLSADPTDASRLRLGQELREIQEKLQLAKGREQFELHQRMSVRPADISQALLDTQSQIIHFSGHGANIGALCFENQVGEMHLIQPDALAALFEQFINQVSCVVLNACYSEIQANAIAKHIDYVIGMNKAIGDEAAIAFTIGFYQALGAGRTLEDAYKLGCVQIQLQNIPEHLTPVLLKKGRTQS